jgi:hypothetical protein
LRIAQAIFKDQFRAPIEPSAAALRAPIVSGDGWQKKFRWKREKPPRKGIAIAPDDAFRANQPNH